MKTQEIKVVHANISDIVKVRELIKANHIDNIPVEQRASKGFLRYLPDFGFFQERIACSNLYVARQGDKLAGFLWCLSRKEARQDPFFSEMMANIENMSYLGRRVVDYRFHVFGQVCVDERFRKTGALSKLHEFSDLQNASFRFGLTEIDEQNEISYLVHTKRFGMIKVGEYRSAQGTNWRVVIKDYQRGKR